jgi:hypothetical protein
MADDCQKYVGTTAKLGTRHGLRTPFIIWSLPNRLIWDGFGTVSPRRTDELTKAGRQGLCPRPSQPWKRLKDYLATRSPPGTTGSRPLRRLVSMCREPHGRPRRLVSAIAPRTQNREHREQRRAPGFIEDSLLPRRRALPNHFPRRAWWGRPRRERIRYDLSFDTRKPAF